MALGLSEVLDSTNDSATAYFPRALPQLPDCEFFSNAISIFLSPIWYCP